MSDQVAPKCYIYIYTKNQDFRGSQKERFLERFWIGFWRGFGEVFGEGFGKVFG